MLSHTIPVEQRKQAVAELTSFLVHRHYCENDVQTLISSFDDVFSWFGTAEHEYGVGRDTVAGIFRQFEGKVPKCTVSDEHYDVIAVTPEVYICTGRMWIATDPETKIFLRVQQRITAVFHFVDGVPRCCHIHYSNPYSEMSGDDVGFSEGMDRQSSEYFREQLAAHKKRIEEQAVHLWRLSIEDALTGLYNRNKFQQDLGNCQKQPGRQLGIVYFDLNGLKRVNDKRGHHAGDELLCRTAEHIRRFFPHKAYRIGGDEFVAMEWKSDEESFRTAVAALHSEMERAGISCAVGLSWQDSGDAQELFRQADKLMYREKQRFYRSKEKRQGREQE